MGNEIAVAIGLTIAIVVCNIDRRVRSPDEAGNGIGLGVFFGAWLVVLIPWVVELLT